MISSKAKFFNKILYLAIFFISSVFLTVAYSKPSVFLNYEPDSEFAISIGKSRVLPTFFLLDQLQNKPIEIFVIRQFPELGNKQFLKISDNEELLWADFEDNYEVIPLIPEIELPLFKLINWLPPVSPQDSSDFKLVVCVDGQVDGSFPGENFQSERFGCGSTLVKLLKPESSKGIIVSPSSLKLSRSGDLTTTVQVMDENKIPISFKAEPKKNWIKVLPREGKGSFKVSLNKDLLPAERVTGSIVVTAVDKNETVIISVSVPPAPKPAVSEVVVEPTSISLARNIFARATVEVKDKTGSLLPFALSTNKDWLRISPKKGTGRFDVALDMKKLPSTSAKATIRVTVGSETKTVSVSVPGVSSHLQSVRLWPTELSFILQSGQKDSESVSVTCSGKAVSSCTVSGSHEAWLNFDSKCSNGSFKVSVNASDLLKGQKKSELTVRTSCGTKTLPIIFLVQGECKGERLAVAPTSLKLKSSEGVNPSDQTIEIKDNCGKDIQFTVSEVSGKDWIQSPQEGDTGKGQLTIKFDAVSLASREQSYSGSVTVKTSLGKVTIPIRLTIEPPCVATEACLKYNGKCITSSLDVFSTEGSKPSNITIEVIDDCKNQLDFDVNEKISWLTTSIKPGKLTLSFTSSNLSVGEHKGSITVIPKKKNGEPYPEVILKIRLTINATGNVAAIGLKKNDPYRNFTFSPGEIKLFKLRANTVAKPLSVAVEVPSFYSDGDLYVMMKYAGENFEIGPPTLDDYKQILSIIAKDPYKFQGYYQSIHYYFSRHLTKQFNRISTPAVKNGGWYVWVKNIGNKQLRNCAVFYTN